MKNKKIGGVLGKIGLAIGALACAFVVWFLVKYSQVGELNSILDILNLG